MCNLLLNDVVFSDDLDKFKRKVKSYLINHAACFHFPNSFCLDIYFCSLRKLHLSICVSARLFIFMSICYLSVCLSDNLTACLCLFIILSAWLSFYLSLYLSIHLAVYSSIYPSGYVSLYLSIHIFYFSSMVFHRT